MYINFSSLISNTKSHKFSGDHVLRRCSLIALIHKYKINEQILCKSFFPFFNQYFFKQGTFLYIKMTFGYLICIKTLINRRCPEIKNFQYTDRIKLDYKSFHSLFLVTIFKRFNLLIEYGNILKSFFRYEIQQTPIRIYDKLMSIKEDQKLSL